MNYSLITAIATEVWALYEPSARIDVAISILRNDKPAGTDYGASRMENAPYGQFQLDDADDGAKVIRVLPIRGEMLRHDAPSKGRGTESMAALLNEWNQDDSVGGVVLDINSPGGMVSGMQLLSDAISTMKKGIIAYIPDGIAASAAYLAASAADHIVSSHETNRFGSVGVMSTFMDIRGKLEKEGIDVKMIYSSLSPQKNSIFKSALEGDFEPLRTQLLDPAALAFINAVKKFRPGIDESALNGAMFNSKEAIELGMIDSVGNMQTAVNLAASATQRKNKINVSLNSNKMDKQVLDAIAELKGMMAAQNENQVQTDAGNSVAAEMMDRLDAIGKIVTDQGQRLAAIEKILANNPLSFQTPPSSQNTAIAKNIFNPEAEHNKMVAKMRGQQ